jgi:hypothetical protein
VSRARDQGAEGIEGGTAEGQAREDAEITASESVRQSKPARDRPDRKK